MNDATASAVAWSRLSGLKASPAAACSPLSCRYAETIAWKSAPDGDALQRPFHSGAARSAIDFGSCSGVTLRLS